MNPVKWWNKRQQDLKDEYADKERLLTVELDTQYIELKSKLSKGNEGFQSQLYALKRESDELEYQHDKNTKLKVELEKSNLELSEQIKLIEAKARPDEVWSGAFSLGFSKAWDMMLPIMTEGVKKLREQARTEEIEASMKRLNTMVDQKIEELGRKGIRDVKLLGEKRMEFQGRISRSQDKEERNRLRNYLQVIDWIMENSPSNGN